MKIPILTLDAPNHNNRIYPKEVMEKAIAKYRTEHVEHGRAMVVNRLPESQIVNLQDVIGVVKEIGVENDKVVVDIEFLPGMEGALVAKAGIAGHKLHMRTGGIGSVKTDAAGRHVIQDDYEITSCFITDNPA